MASLKNVLKANLVVFSIVVFVHILRVGFGWDLQIGTWMTPLELSVFAILLAGSLAYLNWKHI